MNRILFFASVFFMLSVNVSCRKEDETDKLSANPLPYREDNAAGMFTVKNRLELPVFAVYGKISREYEIEGEIPGGMLDPGTVFKAGNLEIAANQNRFTYSKHQIEDSSLVTVFGQETHYRLSNGTGETFDASLRGPLPIVMSAPLNALDPEPVKVNRKTQIRWNPDPENSGGIIVEIRRPDGKNKYLHVADDGTLTLSSVWGQLPLQGEFSIGIHRGTHLTVTGSDSKKYVINIMSSCYSDTYKI